MWVYDLNGELFSTQLEHVGCEKQFCKNKCKADSLICSTSTPLSKRRKCTGSCNVLISSAACSRSCGDIKSKYIAGTILIKVKCKIKITKPKNQTKKLQHLNKKNQQQKIEKINSVTIYAREVLVIYFSHLCLARDCTNSKPLAAASFPRCNHVSK